MRSHPIIGLALAVAAAICLIRPGLGAEKLTAEAINAAEFSKETTGSAALMTKMQVLLDRAHLSPGVIDGRGGENTDHALAAFQQEQGLAPTGSLDAGTWAKLEQTSPDAVVKEYSLTSGDAKGPFVDEIPAKLEDQAKLKWLSYTSAKEALAEKFHMSEALLSSLNPNASLETAGERIIVADVEGVALPKASKVEVLKSAKAVRLIGPHGKLAAVFPATIGSDAKPAPTGTLKVARIARNPPYEYNPDYAFKGVKTKKSFRIAPGPNNPVGTVWIDLGGDGYGIHGTPDPEKIGKTASHGCVRLTNWDAEALARALKKGTPVEFVE